MQRADKQLQKALNTKGTGRVQDVKKLAFENCCDISCFRLGMPLKLMKLRSIGAGCSAPTTLKRKYWQLLHNLFYYAEFYYEEFFNAS